MPTVVTWRVTSSSPAGEWRHVSREAGQCVRGYAETSDRYWQLCVVVSYVADTVSVTVSCHTVQPWTTESVVLLLCRLLQCLLRRHFNVEHSHFNSLLSADQLAYSYNQIITKCYPAEVGALFTTVSSIRVSMVSIMVSVRDSVK